MAYPQEITFGSFIAQASIATAHNVGTAASGGVWANISVAQPLVVHRYFFQVSTTISDATSGIVEMSKVTVANVTSSVGLITIPNGTVANKVIYKDCTPTKLGVGDRLQFKMKTQAGQGGTPAGAGFHGFLGQLQPEALANETNAIVSA